MAQFKARVIVDVAFVLEVEAEDGFDAIDVAERAARKLTPEQCAEHVTKGTVRSSVVDSVYFRRKK